MPEFLQLLPPADALAVLLRSLPDLSPRVEAVETSQAAGRVLARAVTALESLPAFPRSMVDGYAVRARDTHGSSDSLPAYLALAGECLMGSAPGFAVGPGQAALIHTGGMLPPGADAVVMLEYTQPARAGEVEVLRPVAGGENVIPAGADVQAGAEVLAAGKRLRPADIGGLMALGVVTVAVAAAPVVGILSSGDEVIDPHRQPQPGQVRDVNSYTLSALVEREGGRARRYGILADRRDVLCAALEQSLGACDLVVVTAGSSASSRDLTAQVIDELGRPGVLVHGVSVRPGKPTILAVCDGKPVIGLPGNPVSALVIAGLFVVPLIHRLLGLHEETPRPSVPARLSTNLPSQAGREDWFPVRLVREGAGWRAEPVFYQSNLILALSRADGMVHIPADATGLEAGAEVAVYFL